MVHGDFQIRYESLLNRYVVCTDVLASLALSSDHPRLDYWRGRVEEMSDVLDLLEGKISPEGYLSVCDWKPQIQPMVI